MGEGAILTEPGYNEQKVPLSLYWYQFRYDSYEYGEC
jgi:hypothetical protein